MSHEKNLTEKNSSRKFGVGCFDFRIQRAQNFTLTTADHAKLLEEALQRLNSLSDLDIYYDESLSGTVEIEVEPKGPHLEDGTCFPGLPFGKICFSLFIPKRIQEELSFGGLTTTDTEKFRITMRHAFYGPIAFVECVDAGPECAPSNAVEIVRKYLEKEFKAHSEVVFESLGPSPFHADFFAHYKDGSIGVETTEFPRIGYDKFDLHVAYPLDEPNALDEIFFALEQELDTYYQLERERVIQMNLWGELGKMWNELQGMVKTPPGILDLKGKFQIHKMARNLITDALTFDAQHLMAKQGSTDILKSTYRKGLNQIIKERTELQLIEAFPNYPTHVLVQWATHLHDSSFKLAEIAAIFLSALLGGVVGAALSKLT